MLEFLLPGSVAQNDLLPQTLLVARQETFRNENSEIYHFFLGPRPPPGLKAEYVVLILGETGAGKSTLINAMFNVLFGIRWDDNVRFRIVDEDAKETGTSRTKGVVIYTCYNPYSEHSPALFTIIDTPGFNDTSGIETDGHTKAKLQELFSTKGPGGINHIHAVGIVAKSNETRITSTQQYILNCISSVFSKDIEKNIFLLCTFADSKKPEILKTGRDFADNWFVFNNSALFQEREEGNVMQTFFWSMGESSVNRFLEKVRSIPPISTALSVEVMKERRSLQAIIDGLRQRIREGLEKMHGIKEMQAVVERHKADVNNNKNFTVTRSVPHTIKIPLIGVHVTHCLTCNHSCHVNCTIPLASKKNLCCAMDDKDNCKVCPKKCSWFQHANVDHKTEVQQVQETITIEKMKKEYGIAVDARDQARELLYRMGLFLRAIGDQVTLDIRRMQVSIARIEELALRPNTMTSTDFIDKLIQIEEDQHKSGYKERVHSLRICKESAKVYEGVKDGDMTKLVGDEDERFFKFPPPTNYFNYTPADFSQIRDSASVDNREQSETSNQHDGPWARIKHGVQQVFSPK
ncbi:hypothetical protein BV898_19280 [Hypsibius exemplaris]|uniref:Rad50/SbcC-type AAA domain-containing protein n=1 Tax=Hypsibius exemplaris TaxID=2072580 RepID=A0A9X6RNX9_HYPEX|nr:hypothetical protein BV898_19280 [Hypsibius exemplaris]